MSVTGLSTDSTAEIVRSFPDPWQKIRFIQHGWAADKCELRNRYLELAGEGMLAVLDADEFYTNKSQSLISSCVTSGRKRNSLCSAIPQVHIWQPPGRRGLLGAASFVVAMRMFPQPILLVAALGGCSLRL